MQIPVGSPAVLGFHVNFRGVQITRSNWRDQTYNANVLGILEENALNVPEEFCSGTWRVLWWGVGGP